MTWVKRKSKSEIRDPALALLFTIVGIGSLIWAYSSTAEGSTMATPPVTPPTSAELLDGGTPETVVTVLSRLYDQVGDDLRRMILKPTGGTQSGRDFRMARAQQLISQIERMKRNLDQASGQWVGEKLPKAYDAGQELGSRQALVADPLLAPKVAEISGSFSVIDERALLVLARETLIDLNRASGLMADRATRLIRATAQRNLSEVQINTIISRGIIEGDPRAAIADLRNELILVNNGQMVPVPTKNGDVINMTADHYSKLIVRTKTRAATTIARHERLQLAGLDLVAVIGPEVDDFCEAFLGQVFSLSGTSSVYPSIRSLPGLYPSPPFHPNCRHTTRPFIEHLATPAQLKLAKGIADASKLLGKDMATAQRLYLNLQIGQQVRGRYTKAIRKMFA